MTVSKTAIVTGAYGAIGKAIAEGIARIPLYKVVIIGRDAEKIERSAKDIIEGTGNKNVIPLALDLGRKQEILDLASSWNEPLHLLVNNAATAPRKRILTTEGIEMQWAVNVLGYYWMMEFLHPKMHGQPDARIVNVASYWAGGLDTDDPEFKNRPYNNDDAYRQSKQADRMLSKAFADKFSANGITVNSCHPGDVNSKLSNDLGFGGHESPDKGAATPVWLATSEEVKGITGKYFEHKQEVSCNFSSDDIRVQQLFELFHSY
jgi:NAD(P)-dependent dehydrogenase (short-subunit alcohol dehydrogenase family)